jgi:hypothetical protein
MRSKGCNPRACSSAALGGTCFTPMWSSAPAGRRPIFQASLRATKKREVIGKGDMRADRTGRQEPADCVEIGWPQPRRSGQDHNIHDQHRRRVLQISGSPPGSLRQGPADEHDRRRVATVASRLHGRGGSDRGDEVRLKPPHLTNNRRGRSALFAEPACTARAADHIRAGAVPTLMVTRTRLSGHRRRMCANGGH